MNPCGQPDLRKESRRPNILNVERPLLAVSGSCARVERLTRC